MKACGAVTSFTLTHFVNHYPLKQRISTITLCCSHSSHTGGKKIKVPAGSVGIIKLAQNCIFYMLMLAFPFAPQFSLHGKAATNRIDLVRLSYQYFNQSIFVFSCIYNAGPGPGMDSHGPKTCFGGWDSNGTHNAAVILISSWLWGPFLSHNAQNNRQAVSSASLTRHLSKDSS